MAAARKEPEARAICIKWGTRYPVDYVNRLYNMVQRHTTCDVRFYCFTEISGGLHPDITVKPLPELNVAPEDNRYAYRKEAALCQDDLGGLQGCRVVFFDLDVVIVDNIDELFSFPQGDDFVIIKDWNSRGNLVGQASCYSWRVGTLGHIKKHFEDNPREVVRQFRTASQEYLSYQVIKTRGPLVFWPEHWFRSFKSHCLPARLLRRFRPAVIPPGARVIVFHGSPKPEQALVGNWLLDKDKPVPLYKRWYKAVKPTPWIAEHWK